jgi:hypothetical protein
VVLIGGWVEKDMGHGFFGIASLPPGGRTGQDWVCTGKVRDGSEVTDEGLSCPVGYKQYINEIYCVPRLMFWCRRWCELFRIRTFDISG